MYNFSNITAVILAGGLGTRLAPIIKNKPKVLAEVKGHPFLQYLLEVLNKNNFKNVVLCTGFLGDQIKQTFGQKYKNIHLLYSNEPVPLGTGGGLRNALSFMNTNIVLVMNGDSFCDVDFEQFLGFHMNKNSSASLVLASVSDTSNFGTVKLVNHDSIIQFREKKKGKGLVNAGIYLINKTLIEKIPLKKISLEKEIFPTWIGKGFYGYKSNKDFIDIGTPQNYKKAEQFFVNYPL